MRAPANHAAAGMTSAPLKRASCCKTACRRREYIVQRHEKQESWSSNQASRNQAMAPRKRSLQEPSSATADAPTTRIGIDETHAVQLARHLAELYKRRRFTDLKVP